VGFFGATFFVATRFTSLPRILIEPSSASDDNILKPAHLGRGVARHRLEGDVGHNNGCDARHTTEPGQSSSGRSSGSGRGVHAPQYRASSTISALAIF